AIDYATTSGRNGKGCAVFIASGNSGEPWVLPTTRMKVSVPAGSYKFGFYYVTSGNQIYDTIAIDDVRLLNLNGYDFLWSENFESGATGWSFAHGGGATADWMPSTSLQ